MASLDRALLARLMAAMAAGDAAALFPFIDEFGDRLAGTVRSVLHSLGRADMARDPHNIDYLVQSAGLVIFDRASGWDPDGALPWTWASRAIRSSVVSWLGHPSVELPDGNELTDAVSHRTEAGSAAQADVDFDQMSTTDPGVALLVRAVRLVASERDAEVHLQFQTQKALGDRQPANTVAHMMGLSPANVRKINERVRAKLSQLAATDADFAGLARVAWVEAC